MELHARFIIESAPCWLARSHGCEKWQFKWAIVSTRLGKFNTFNHGVKMSAIELYYSARPVPSGPYYAGDDEDDDNEMNEEERAIFEEQMYRDF